LATQELSADHRPDFTNTEPVCNIGPFPQWSDPKKIVAMDPWGHLAPEIFKSHIDEGIDIRPTIAVTKAHMHLPELEHSVKAGRLKVDGDIVVNELGELAVTKFAVEPCWYLPGVAERFGVGKLRCFLNFGSLVVMDLVKRVNLLFDILSPHMRLSTVPPVHSFISLTNSDGFCIILFQLTNYV
jgi:hypothetical protein